MTTQPLFPDCEPKPRVVRSSVPPGGGNDSMKPVGDRQNESLEQERNRVVHEGVPATNRMWRDRLSSGFYETWYKPIGNAGDLVTYKRAEHEGDFQWYRAV